MRIFHKAKLGFADVICNVGFVRIPVARHLKMLRDGRMAGMVKLHRGDQPGTERQVWAVLIQVPNLGMVRLVRDL